MASSAAPTTRPLPAISVGALPRSSTSRVSQRRDYRVAAVTSGSAALPSVMAASTPRSGSRSMSGSTGRSRIGHLVYTNAYPGHSETGLRGLTTVPSPSGHGEVLLAAVEGNAARIVRVDPRDGSEATELNLADFLVQRWGMRAGYVIAAYNNMAKIQRAFRPRADPRRSRPRIGGDPLDPGFAVPAGAGRALFCRLRRKQGAGAQHRLDLPLDTCGGDRDSAVVIGSSLRAHCE